VEDVATAEEVGGPPSQSSATTIAQSKRQFESNSDGTGGSRASSTFHHSTSTPGANIGNSEGSLQYPEQPL
jgi:hypothetical protein